MSRRPGTESTEPLAGVASSRARAGDALSLNGAVEGFALETDDGLIFTVKGLVQPPDRTIAYLRYLPDASGDRRRDGVRYRRVYAFGDMIEALESRGGDAYFVDEPAFGLRVQAVPHARVRAVHDPRLRLAGLREGASPDALETQAVRVAGLVGAAAGVSLGHLGVSGSLLFGLHTGTSDIDAVVYGEDACRAVHDALACLLDDPGSGITRHDADGLAAIAAAHRTDTPVSTAEFARLQGRKVNECAFDGRQVFFRFVKRSGEGRERYGDPRYEQVGPAVIRARVVDASDAMFTPCSYRIDRVVVEEGARVRGLDTITSFRGRFADQAREGEWVAARGMVERVIPLRGEPRARLTVGAPGDFLVGAPDLRATIDVPPHDQED